MSTPVHAVATPLNTCRASRACRARRDARFAPCIPTSATQRVRTATWRIRQCYTLPALRISSQAISLPPLYGQATPVLSSRLWLRRTNKYWQWRIERGGGRWGRSPLIGSYIFFKKSLFRVKGIYFVVRIAINEDGADKLSPPFFQNFGSATENWHWVILMPVFLWPKCTGWTACRVVSCRVSWRNAISGILCLFGTGFDDRRQPCSCAW